MRGIRSGTAEEINIMKRIFLYAIWIGCIAYLAFISFRHVIGKEEIGVNEGFSPEELAIIEGADSLLRVLTIEDEADLKILRSKSTDLPAEAIQSEEFARLAELMIATVTHPSQDGVGIAGPQVGISRRVVAVQRFDKEPVLRGDKLDYPFEVYPNIRIVWASDSLAAGPEGCLSVPDRRGDVLRSQEIVIEYAAASCSRAESDGNCGDGHGDCGGKDHSSGQLQTVRDTVRGFTAVIFQHETDHLDGILYIDRL